MRNIARSFVIGSLALSAAAFAGVQANQGGVGAIAPNVGNDNGQLPIREKFDQTFPGGQLLENNGHLRRVWGRQFSWGNSPHQSAETFMKNWSELWGVPYSQLQATGPFEDGSHLVPLTADDAGGTDFTAVYWTQQVRGVPVFRSTVWGLVGNEDNFPMVLAGGTLKNLGNFPASIANRNLDASTLDASVYTREAFNQFNAPPTVTSPRYVVWAGIDAHTVETTLAIEFVATGGNALDPDNYQLMQFVVDADTGAILHQESQILHGTATAQINGLATPGTKASACTTATLVGLPYAKATIAGATLYADVNGKLVYTYSGTAAVTVAPTLTGKYFTVTDSAATVQVVASQSIADGATGTFQYPSTTNQYTHSEIDTYVAANQEHDFVLAMSPGYPTIATQTGMTIVNNTSGTCNAFYNGNINFYPSGGGCNNTGYSSVLWHEYGHHMVSSGGSGQAQYGEGFGDVMAVLMGDESVLGFGFQSCSAGIRDANNTCVGTATSSTCGTEIHAWGQVLSGCVWNLRNQFVAAYPSDYKTRLAKLAINEVPLHAGQSDIWTDITVDYLTLDDAPSNGGNNNIGDGTPNYSRISTAFGAHGLSAPALNLMTITPGTVPSTVNPNGGDQMSVSIVPVTATIAAGSQKMFMREGAIGAFTGYLLTSAGGNNYTATFPAANCNASLQFYFEAKTTAGSAVTSPASAPASVLTTISITPGGSVVLFADNFESAPSSFVVTGSPASGLGGWEQAVPNGRSCNAPSTTSRCFITGKAASTGQCNDLDGGPTNLTSPTFDASAAEACEVSFQTYYLTSPSTNTGDPLKVQVSNNGGSTWVQMAAYTTTGTWTTRTLNLRDYVALTNNMQIRFVAEDNASADNTVVCGIDNFAINTITCTTALQGDLDGNGMVDIGDAAFLLLDFGDCSGTSPSDLDGSGCVDVGDVAFLLLLFT